MLAMEKIRFIKHEYETDGKSLRRIADEMRLNFRTVQKYAQMDDFSETGLPNLEQANYPVMGPFIPIVDKWLEQDMKEPRKQRHTAKHIFDRLHREYGFNGGYTSVKRYVRKKKLMLSRTHPGYLPLAHPAGSAQVDFGDFKYYDAMGNGHEGHALIVSFPNANTGWMQVFPSENQECLLTGLQLIFRHIGGVPPRVRLDNMSTAVVQVLKGTERVVTDGFTRFMLHHRFEAEFCNPNSGNEKGNVENKVGYTRRNMLVPVPVIEDFEAFNKELLRRCDEDHARPHYIHGRLISELWAEERNALLALPAHEYEVFRYEALTPDKYGFVHIDKNKYGLPPSLSKCTIQAKIYYDKVSLYYDRQLLKTYDRSYKKREEVTDWTQYLPTLLKKPGAVEHTRFFDQIPKLWGEYLRGANGGERKSALTLLSEIVSDGNAALCDDALELAAQYGKTDADSIRQCYLLISKPENHPRPLELSAAPPQLGYRPDLRIYDSLMARYEEAAV